MNDLPIKRILSIDGGGIKGVFPASFLASVEDSIGQKVFNYFDLIVGTSTGGIIALGLALGFSAKEILGFYEDWGPKIFNKLPFLHTVKWLGLSKYSQKTLKEALEKTFGDKKIGDCHTRLVVPSMNLENGEVYIYKTSHQPRFEMDYKVSAVDAALATAAAPTYFPAHRANTGTPLIDGGIWANNPVGLAVVEAIGVLGWNKDSLRVLSLGCTDEPLNVDLGRNCPLGAGYWVTKLTKVFMTAQSSYSLGTAYVLAGHENIIRISPQVMNGKFSLDGSKSIFSLKGLGDSEARKALPELRPMFLDKPVEPFVPFNTVKITEK